MTTVRASSSPRRAPSRRSTARRAYGTSSRDGAYVERPGSAFGRLIDAARGTRDVLQAGSPALRDVAREVDPREIDSTEIQELIAEMLRACRARGVGLAAPQLGARVRVVALEDTAEGMADETREALATKRRAPFAAKVIVNPTLTPIGDASAAFFEGCLSVAGYRAVVRRHLRCDVEGSGATGSRWISKPWDGRRGFCSTRSITWTGCCTRIAWSRERCEGWICWTSRCRATTRSSATR